MRSMTWGFRLRLKGMQPEAKPKPVNNIADLTKGMWIGLARKPQWRCIIPLTAFAEAEGPKGAKTRTWFSVKNQPVFAWGGLWRASDEWGAVYSGAKTDANSAVELVHDRMPILLHRHEYEQWLNGRSMIFWKFRGVRFHLTSSISIERAIRRFGGKLEKTMSRGCCDRR